VVLHGVVDGREPPGQRSEHVADDGAVLGQVGGDLRQVGQEVDDLRADLGADGGQEPLERWHQVGAEHLDHVVDALAALAGGHPAEGLADVAEQAEHVQEGGLGVGEPLLELGDALARVGPLVEVVHLLLEPVEQVLARLRAGREDAADAARERLGDVVNLDRLVQGPVHELLGLARRVVLGPVAQELLRGGPQDGGEPLGDGRARGHERQCGPAEVAEHRPRVLEDVVVRTHDGAELLLEDRRLGPLRGAVDALAEGVSEFVELAAEQRQQRLGRGLDVFDERREQVLLHVLAQRPERLLQRDDGGRRLPR
jgi:hypothetical protein